MINFRKIVSVGAMGFCAVALAACGNLQTVKSFSTQYQQPVAGDMARIRVVSYDGMVRAVPNSACIDWRRPGAGVMVSASRGFADVNDQNLGMPVGKFSLANAEAGSVAVSELKIPAGKPFALYYLSQGGIRFTSIGSVREQCHIKKYFIPVPGENYEASFEQLGSGCEFTIKKIKPEGGVETDGQVELKDAALCRKGDVF